MAVGFIARYIYEASKHDAAYVEQLCLVGRPRPPPRRAVSASDTKEHSDYKAKVRLQSPPPPARALTS